MDLGAYVDPYGFRPLDERREELLGSIVGDAEGGELLGRYDLDLARELEARGLLASVRGDLVGNACGRVTRHGAGYADDKAAWLSRVEAWQTERSRGERAARRHDWALNLVNGVYAIAGAVIGWLPAHYLG